MIRNAVIFLILILFASCREESMVYEKNYRVAIDGWDYKAPFEFEFLLNSPDTFNLYLNVRYNKQFEWRNLWVEINTILPNGQSTKVKKNLKLETAQGETYGKCTGDICFVQVPFQYNAIFPDSGLYEFQVIQNMRVNPIKDIENIGLRIENS